ncbi:PepSY domain-containing protein [Fontivita pretiosa]|uniref:PepSY domain-containing protein n=1 Tax=Fontivita pretiosa TaxID=2989684 RepID=UPI003D170F62
MNQIKRFGAVLLAAALTLGGCEMFDKDRHDKNDEGTKEERIEVSALPANVRAAFDKAYPGATIKKAEKETYADGTIHYEIEFAAKDGTRGEVEIDAAGEVLPEH